MKKMLMFMIREDEEEQGRNTIQKCKQNRAADLQVDLL